MSNGLLVQGAGMTLEVLTQQKPSLAGDLFLQSFGIGSELGMLAYSRKHESEADKMGLIFMAMAGYDPRRRHLLGADECWGGALKDIARTRAMRPLIRS
ncbi:MAG: M48 family metalloprotease [Flavobacteriales bacterium]|nr:M48 family metalloprotease [Flavobacteriales bacterium]